MTNDDRPVGYKQPPIHSRFQKGKSGNPSGRPKKRPDFTEDAIQILGAPVTGHANGKEITLPAVQAMFRRICRKALQGDNASLRLVVELMLTLKANSHSEADWRSKSAADKARQELQRKLKAIGERLRPHIPDSELDRITVPDHKMEEYRKQADAMAREERKRLIREARQRQ